MRRLLYAAFHPPDPSVATSRLSCVDIRYPMVIVASLSSQPDTLPVKHAFQSATLRVYTKSSDKPPVCG